MEPVSNSKYYLPEILKRGYVPIAIFPKAGSACRFAREQVMHYVKDLAESVYILRNNDPESILDLLTHYNIEAIISGNEPGGLLTDFLSDRLGLPGNSMMTTAYRHEKIIMQKRLKEAGLNYVESKSVSNVDDGIQFAIKLDEWPLILKWRAETGERRIRCCHNIDEFKKYLEEIFLSPFSEEIQENSVYVQEYIRGSEYAVHTASCDGEHQITDFWENHKFISAPYSETYDYAKLVTHLDTEQKEICEYVLKAISMLGFRFGPAHSVVISSDRGPVLVDCSTSPMNGPFPVKLLKECLGHCIVDRALDCYLDPDKFQKESLKPYQPKKTLLCKLFFAPKEINIASVPLVTLSRFLPTAKQGNFVSSIHSFQLSKTTNFYTLPGTLFFCDRNEDRVMEDYENLRAIEIGDFSILFNEKCISRDYPDQKLSIKEEQLYFPPVKEDDYCWHIGAAEKPERNYKGWHYVGAGRWPDSKVNKVVITGLANVPDWEILINNIGLLSRHIPVNGELTVIIPKKCPVSYRAWELLLAALGWSVKSVDNHERLEFVKTRKDR